MFRFAGQSGCTVPRNGGQSEFTVPLNWGQSGLLSLTTRDTWSLLSLVPQTMVQYGLFVTQCEGFHGKPVLFQENIEACLNDKFF